MTSRQPECPAVTAVIVNWNGWEETLETLEAVDQLEQPDVGSIVVDNASRDGSVKELLKARPDTEVVESSFNGGYGGGSNIGINLAVVRGFEFVWVLNNGARPRTNALTRPLQEMRGDDSLGVVATNIDSQVCATATIYGGPILCGEGVGACFSRLRPGFHSAHMLRGPSLLVRSEVFRQIGTFDERYFHYWEQEDLIERARRAGWRLGFSCESYVDQPPRSSLPRWSPQANYYSARNAILFDRWNGSPQRWSAMKTLWEQRRVVQDTFKPGRLRNGDTRYVTAFGLAMFDAMRERSGYRNLGDDYSRV